MLVGYHKKGYPNQSNKKHKRQSILTTITGVRAPAHSTRPTPKGLGRKFRLARPPRASDASSDSPDPPGPRTQVPTRPTPQGLGRKFRLARPLPGSGAGPHSTWAARLPPHGAHTHDVTGAMTPIPQQGRVSTIPTTLDTAALPLSLSSPTSFTVVNSLIVKEEWERLINITICCFLSLLT